MCRALRFFATNIGDGTTYNQLLKKVGTEMDAIYFDAVFITRPLSELSWRDWMHPSASAIDNTCCDCVDNLV